MTRPERFASFFLPSSLGRSIGWCVTKMRTRASERPLNFNGSLFYASRRGAQIAHCVDAEYRDFIVLILLLYERQDVAFIAGNRGYDARDQIKERDVVISRYADYVRRDRAQRFDECRCRPEFPAQGALREVAGDDDDIRGKRSACADERLGDRRIGAAEVNIRNVEDRSHV
jgi:hypothetical protein